MPPIKLQELERVMTEDAVLAVWRSLDGLQEMHVPLDWAEHMKTQAKGRPPKDPSVPDGWVWAFSITFPKYTNGQTSHNLLPGQMGDVGGPTRRGQGPLRIIVPDQVDGAKEETRFLVPLTDIERNGKGEITILGDVAVEDEEKGKRFFYKVQNGSLTKQGEEPL